MQAFFDNINSKVVDDLKVSLKKGTKLSIASACFSIYAFQELKEQLQGIDELRFIFTAPSFLKDEESKQRREFYIPRIDRERTLYGSSFEVNEEGPATLLQEPALNKYGSIAKNGLTDALKEYYAASTNSEKVLILKSILDNIQFVELKRFSRSGCRLFAMCQSENDLPSSDEFPGNLSIARKLMANGYDVYMLGNPNGIKSADFIATKKNMVYYLEGKTMNGKGSLDELLDKAASQAENIIVDVIGTEDAAYIAREIKSVFEHYIQLRSVGIFKGSRLILTTRRHLASSKFEREFIKLWIG